MTSEAIVMVALGSFAGGFINGLAGFGTALFALGLEAGIAHHQRGLILGHQPGHAVALERIGGR